MIEYNHNKTDSVSFFWTGERKLYLRREREDFSFIRSRDSTVENRVFVASRKLKREPEGGEKQVGH